MNYRGPEGKVELMGVCSVSETEVKCWGPDRKPQQEVREMVLEAFKRNDHMSLPVTYGKKTRFAIFKFTHPSRSLAEGVVAESFGYPEEAWLDLGRSSSSNADAIRVSYHAATIRAPFDQKTGTVSASIFRTTPVSEPLEVKEGASISYLGSTIKIVKIVRSQLDPAVYGGSGLDRWVIYYSTTPELLSTQAWFAKNFDGLDISAVDEAGNPIYVDPEILETLSNPTYQGGLSRKPVTPKSIVFAAAFGPSHYHGQGHAPGTADILTTNINPEKIRYVALTTSSSQTIKIGNIPLDPLK